MWSSVKHYIKPYTHEYNYITTTVLQNILKYTCAQMVQEGEQANELKVMTNWIISEML